MNKPLTIAVAPNGARRSAADHTALPIAPDEIAETALQCLRAGASMIHLHVRDEAGQHSLEPRFYQKAIQAIHDRCGPDITVQITTEACGIFDRQTQMDCVRQVRPRAASFALRELVPDEDSEADAREFFTWVRDADILPQFILYEPVEALRLRALMENGVIPFFQPAVLFVLGRYGHGPASHPSMIFQFVEAWGESDDWAVCAFGQSEILVAAAAIALGGNVRVGFENNIYRLNGELLENNAEQVKRVSQIAAAIGRPIAQIVLNNCS